MYQNSGFAYECNFKDGSKKLVSDQDLWWVIKFYTTVFHGVQYLVYVLGWVYSSIFTVATSSEREIDQLKSTSRRFGENTILDFKHHEKLGVWLKKNKCPSVRFDECVLPIPERELSSFVRFACFYYSHITLHADVCSKCLRHPQIVAKIRNEVQCLLRSVQSNTKSKNVCHRLVAFLTSFYNSTDQEVLEFLSELTIIIRRVPFSHYLRQCHATAHMCEADKYRSQAVTILTSIFMKRNAHVLTFYLRKEYLNPDWFSTSALQIISWFASHYCGFDECDIEDFKLLDRRNGTNFKVLHHLLFRTEAKFEPILTRYASHEPDSMKATYQWDFLINLCDDVEHEDWDTDMMERTAWALGSGRKYVSEELFDLFHRNRLNPSINFTFYDVQKLLALSISGLVQFKGFDACMFNLTANKHALFTVHGYFKKPTMEDLVKLKLFRQAKNGLFYACDFPGSAMRHKGVCVGERILIVQSKENALFRAKLSQKVG